jgi:hypothetical protein
LLRGVCWNKKNKRWQAAINSGGKYLYLGSYQEEEEAARAFDKAAIKIRGKKAKLNFSYVGEESYGELLGRFRGLGLHSYMCLGAVAAVVAQLLQQQLWCLGWQ